MVGTLPRGKEVQVDTWGCYVRPGSKEAWKPGRGLSLVPPVGWRWRGSWQVNGRVSRGPVEGCLVGATVCQQKLALGQTISEGGCGGVWHVGGQEEEDRLAGGTSGAYRGGSEDPGCRDPLQTRHSSLPKLSGMATSGSKTSSWTPPTWPGKLPSAGWGSPEAASWPLGLCVQGDSDTSHVWV